MDWMKGCGVESRKQASKEDTNQAYQVEEDTFMAKALLSQVTAGRVAAVHFQVAVAALRWVTKVCCWAILWLITMRKACQPTWMDFHGCYCLLLMLYYTYTVIGKLNVKKDTPERVVSLLLPSSKQRSKCTQRRRVRRRITYSATQHSSLCISRSHDPKGTFTQSKKELTADILYLI